MTVREAIEAVYCRSTFVQEICVLRRPPAAPGRNGLFAVVVPNLELLRARRVVNVGDLLRFELEGQSIDLPAERRIDGHEIWLDPLPRMATGQVDRRQVARRVRARRAAAKERANQFAAGWWHGDPVASAVVAALTARARGLPIAPDANLELDLGLDSMARVELLSEVEQAFGLRIAESVACTVATVGQLIEVVRGGASEFTPAPTKDAWALLLHDAATAEDPALRALLQPRPLARRLFFLAPRLVRLVLPRVQVLGLDNLPRDGPCIIAPNHQGYLDSFLVCGALPYRLFERLIFVGAVEYFETPVMARVARAGNCVPVDPDAKLVEAMRAGAFALAHGRSLLLFPEGERSIDGTVKRFKKGAAMLARRLRVPVVPVAIRGSYDVWPRNRPVNWRRLWPWSGHRVRVVFGPPMALDRYADDAAAAAAVQSAVEAMWASL